LSTKLSGFSSPLTLAFSLLLSSSVLCSFIAASIPSSFLLSLFLSFFFFLPLLSPPIKGRGPRKEKLNSKKKSKSQKVQKRISNKDKVFRVKKSKKKKFK